MLIILTINLASCLNKPDHSPLHEYELVIDSIIEGYDSKDIEVYKNAQYRIAESFILYDIIEDSLLSSKDKDYLATKLDQPNQHGTNMIIIHSSKQLSLQMKVK